MAKFGSALEKYMRVLNEKIDEGLIQVGTMGVEVLKEEPNIKDRVYEGRLEDSISFATKSTQSDMGVNAESGDHVQTPFQPGIVHIGTECPYAVVHNYGGGTINFQYGQNGNPASREELVNKLKGWCIARGIDPKYAGTIATNIENNEQGAYPFWHSALAQIKERANEEFAKGFNSVQASYTSKESV